MMPRVEPGNTPGPRRRRPVEGVLLLDKPAGITSNAALQIVKRLLRAEKAGHVGTLDPAATGLLPICLGEATKFSQGLADADKSYDATVVLGVTTSTGDAEGEVTARAPVAVDPAVLERAAAVFRGEILQVPPMHSALKHRGRPLYEYARAGTDVVREARPVTIFRLEVLEFDGVTVRLQVSCSKGTYIRTLAEDIGSRLGCGAHLGALRRTSVGPFGVAEGVELGALEAMQEGERDRCLRPLDALVGALPAVTLGESAGRAVCHGGAVDAPAGTVPGPVRLYLADGRFVGVGDISGEGKLAPRRLVAGSVPAAGHGTSA